MKIIVIYGNNQKKDGSLDKESRGRCEKAVSVFKRHDNAVIYITAGISRNGKIMAFEMANYLKERGVPLKVIKVIPKAFSTIEETKVVSLCLTGGEQIIAVSSFYHLPRIAIIWLLRGWTVTLSPVWRVSLMGLILGPLFEIFKTLSLVFKKV